jgi:hypothetical protein
VGLSELVAKTILQFSADTSDLKAKLKELQGEEKKLAQAQLEAAQQRNEGLKTWAEKLATAGLALEGVTRVVEFAKESMKEYGDNLRLGAAAGKADVDSLSDSFNGLITHHQALTFAAQAQHGVLKINQEQMETVGKATVALTRAGFDQTEVYNKLTDAVVSLKTRGLDDYGISVKEGKTETETLSNIITALNQKVQENSGLMETEAEKITKAANAWADFKEELGSAVAQMAEAIPQADELIKLADNYNSNQDKFGLSHADELLGKATVDLGYNLDEILKDSERISKNALPSVTGAVGVLTKTLQGINTEFSEYGVLGAKIEAFGAKAKKAYDEARTAAEALARAQKELSKTVSKSLTDDLVKQLEEEQSQAFLDKGVTGGLGSITPEKNMPELDRAMAAQEKLAKQNKNQTFIENLFGKQDELAAYKTALSGLFDAAASGLDAIIVGGEAGSKSFAKSIGSILHSLAVQEMTFGFAKEGEAIADLIALDPAKAAIDAAAGAKYLATGAAIDIVAKGLGYSAGGSSSKPSGGGGGGASGGGASAGTGGGGGGGPSQPQQKSAIIVVGESFDNSTPRMRQLKAQQLVNRALGNGAYEDS